MIETYRYLVRDNSKPKPKKVDHGYATTEKINKTFNKYDKNTHNFSISHNTKEDFKTITFDIDAHGKKDEDTLQEIAKKIAKLKKKMQEQKRYLKCLSTGRGFTLIFKTSQNDWAKQKNINDIYNTCWDALHTELLMREFQLKADHSAADYLRAFRCTGTMNTITNTECTTVFELQGKSYNVQEIMKAVHGLEAVKKTTKTKDEDFTAWEILKMEDPDENLRGSCVMKLIAAHKQQGLNIKEEASEINRICEHIAKNNTWEDYNAKITREKVIVHYKKYAHKPNPNEEETKEEPDMLNSANIPTTKFVDFSKYTKLLKNTHKHLDAYELINTELGLIGEEYYPIKKNLCYDMESQRQHTITFQIGTEFFDNRIHNAFMGGGNMGKGKTKTLSKQSISQGEISAQRTHIEQLIGKMKKVKNHYQEEEGFFRRKKLLVDESGSLLTEEEKNDAAIMREMRIAMDVYGFNQVEKKLVDTGQLAYYPETRFSFFVHDTIFPPTFFDRGTYRRLFMFLMKPKKINENASDINLYATKNKNSFKTYIRSQGDIVNSLEFPPKTIDAIVKAKKVWNRFTLQNENKRVRAIAQRVFFGLNQYFFRVVGILAISKNEKQVSVRTAELASLDCIHFLMETFTVYCNKSQINYSRDIWKTEIMEEAAFFEWLYLNGATTQKGTSISALKAQHEIGNLFGVNERQARSKFSDLKRKGYINSKQEGRHSSKAWLAFEPDMEGTIEIGKGKVPTMEQYIKSQLMKLHNIRVAGVAVC